MSKIKEVMKQKFSRKQSYRKIAQNLNLSVTTVSNYVERARQAGIKSWQEVESLSNEDLHRRLFGERKKEITKKYEQIDWDEVDKELRRKGVTLRLLWQEYKETRPDGIGYTQFCEHYKKHNKTLEPVMRQVHKAGEKCFVDYAGTTMSYTDSATGKIMKAQIFVGSLGASSYTYVEATRSQSIPDWITSNKNMLNFYGGCPLEIIPDNLKAGVKKPDRYDPDIHPVYREFSLHYNVAIMPARVVHPRDKATAESAVHLVTTQIIAPLGVYGSKMLKISLAYCTHNHPLT